MAMDLAPLAYGVAKSLPRVETYGLGDQIRRSAVSIAANLAEGQARQHTGEFLQFTCIARGSVAELDTLLLLCERLGYVTPAGLEPLKARLEALRFALLGLSAALTRKLHSATVR